MPAMLLGLGRGQKRGHYLAVVKIPPGPNLAPLEFFVGCFLHLKVGPMQD